MLSKYVALFVVLMTSHAVIAAPRADVNFDSVNFDPGRSAAVVPTQEPQPGQLLILPTTVRSVATGLTLVKQSYTDSATDQTIESPVMVITDTGETLGSATFRFHPDDEATTGRIAITFDVLMDSSSDGTFHISFRNAANELIGVYQIFTDSGAVGMVQYDAPGVFSGTTGVADPTTFTTGAVHRVRIIADLDNHTLSMVIDGKSLRTKSLSGKSSLGCISFSSSSEGVLIAAIDNIIVDQHRNSDDR